MRRKRAKNRRLVIGESTYVWRTGSSYLEVRLLTSEAPRPPSRALFRLPLTEVHGVSWDYLERAAWKRYWPALTPGRVAELIRAWWEKERAA